MKYKQGNQEQRRTLNSLNSIIGPVQSSALGHRPTHTLTGPRPTHTLTRPRPTHTLTGIKLK